MSTYRAIVIGCGKIGALWGLEPARPQPASHAAAIVANPNLELVGLIDQDAENLKRAGAFYNVPTYADARAGILASKPDLAIIATPPSTHAQLLMLAVELGVPVVVCEKPVSDTLESARRMIEAVQRSGTTVIVNHQRRFFPLFLEARARIAAGELGRIQQVSTYYTNGLLNNGTHLLDAAQFLLGDTFTWAIGMENTLNTAAPFGNNIDGILGTQAGTVISVQSLDNDSYGVHDLLFYGTKGALAVRQYGFSFEWIEAGDVTFPGAMLELDWAKMRRQFDRRSMLEATIGHTVDCLNGARSLSTLDDGYQTMQVLDALTRSAAKDGEKIMIS